MTYSTSADIPVLLIIFNRPEKTKKLIEALEKVKPKHLYIVADGPRTNTPSDTTLCAEARQVSTHIPWPCTITTQFSTVNGGPDITIANGITWFFNHVEAGIILEDDCIPGPSFFSFCSELLEYYKDNEKIMHISGNNFQQGTIHGTGSYYFSHYSHSWGWATWRRAWQHYHDAVAHFPDYDRSGRINELPFTTPAKNFWIKLLRNTAIWDSRWQYTIWYCRGLCVLPNQNLVSNIGFGTDATHTTDYSVQANVAYEPLTNIVHPNNVIVSTEADDFAFREIFFVPLWKRVRFKLNGIISKLI